MKSLIGTVTMDNVTDLDHTILGLGSELGGQGDRATVKSIYVQAVSTDTAIKTATIAVVGKDGTTVGIRQSDISANATTLISVENGNSLLALSKYGTFALKITCPKATANTIVFSYVVNYE